MTDLGGGLIEGYEPQYGFFLYQDEKQTYFVLQRLSGYQGNKAMWEYVHYVVLPQYKSTQRFIYSFCQKNGVPDSRIAAIVLHEDKEMLDKVSIAWAADLKQKKIAQINTEGIACVNEGHNL